MYLCHHSAHMSSCWHSMRSWKPLLNVLMKSWYVMSMEFSRFTKEKMGCLLAEGSIWTVPQIKLLYYSEEKTLKVYFYILERRCRNPILWDPAQMSPFLRSHFCFRLADLTMPVALFQQTGHFSSIALTTLPYSYLYFLFTPSIWTSWGQRLHFIHLWILPR